MMRSISFVFGAHFAMVSKCLQFESQRPVSRESDIAKEERRVCVGDMCGRRTPDAMHERNDKTLSAGTEYDLDGEKPYCESNPSSKSRVVLLPQVPEHHGSTALESILMSSKKVTTLCSANTWQCEGYRIFGSNNPAERDDWLEQFGHIWNLNKHVLLEKGPRDSAKIKVEMKGFARELQSGPPKIMGKAGIKNISFLHLILWRPICMGSLSSQSKSDSVDHAREELRMLEDQVTAHKRMVSENQPVLVVSLADLMWAQAWTKSRLEKRMPCLGKLDFDSIPELWKDIFPKNDFKVDTSVQEFGLANPASQCDYDLEQRTCSNKHFSFKNLPPDEHKRAYRATRYLDYLSQH